MTPRRHNLRRVAKWTGLGCSLLVLAAYVAGLFWLNSLVIHSGTYLVWLSTGCGDMGAMIESSGLNRTMPTRVQLFRRDIAPLSMRLTTWNAKRFGVCWPRFERDSRTDPNDPLNQECVRYVISLPFWLLFALSAIPTAILFRLDRRYPPGHCPKCGYNLTANTSGRCPECGTPAHPVSGAPTP